jgi:zinc protease
MIKQLRFFSFKQFFFSFLSIIIVLGIHFQAIADTPKHYTELEFPPLPEVTLPEYVRYQLDNGMTIYLVEDRDLPLINGSAMIRTGSRFEPGDKAGLASFTGYLMRNGGTKNHTAEEIDSILEQKAASIEVGIDIADGTASFSSLTEDLDNVLNLFAEVIQKPVFSPKRLELVKNQQKGAIARRNDDPEETANREFNKLIYGATSPYGRTVENETVDNITREELLAFYQQYIRPENMILGIVGDFDTKQMQAKIKQSFGQWKVTTLRPALEIPTAKQQNQSGVYLIDRPNLTQSSVLIGHLGDTFKNPDYPILSVVNGLLNGFGGRLFNEVRSRQGLAYSVYGMWHPNYDYPGQFIAGGQTQTESTVSFIQSVFAEITKLQTNSVGEQELTNARESILNSFVFNFQNSNQTLSRLIRYEYFDYPEDFIFQYQEEVKNTTVEDIQRVAKQYLKPEQAITLVVGNNSAINPPLSSLKKEIATIELAL